MRTRILSVVTVMLLVQAGTTWRAEAQERQNLKGLSGIAVHAGAIGNAAVSVTQIESVLRQKLQDAGITIVAAQAPCPYCRQGNLWANLVVLPSATEQTPALCRRDFECMALSRSQAVTTGRKRLPGR